LLLTLRVSTEAFSLVSAAAAAVVEGDGTVQGAVVAVVAVAFGVAVLPPTDSTSFSVQPC